MGKDIQHLLIKTSQLKITQECKEIYLLLLKQEVRVPLRSPVSRPTPTQTTIFQKQGDGGGGFGLMKQKENSFNPKSILPLILYFMIILILNTNF